MHTPTFFCRSTIAILFLVMNSFAADLDRNLVRNPGFESVNTAQTLSAWDRFTSSDDVVQLRSWDDKNGDGDDNFAATYSQWRVGKGVALPDGGKYHFFGGFATSRSEVTAYQEIALSGGDTALPSAFGTAQFYLSGYFTSVDDGDLSSRLRAEFAGPSRPRWDSDRWRQDLRGAAASLFGERAGARIQSVTNGFHRERTESRSNLLLTAKARRAARGGDSSTMSTSAFTYRPP